MGTFIQKYQNFWTAISQRNNLLTQDIESIDQIFNTEAIWNS